MRWVGQVFFCTRSVLVKLEGSPVADVVKKVTSDVNFDFLALLQLDRPRHPHRLRRIGVDPLHNLLLTLTAAVSYQNHRLGLAFLGGSAEGHLCIEEVEAVLLAEDGVFPAGQEAGATALRVHPGPPVSCCHTNTTQVPHKGPHATSRTPDMFPH